MVPGVRGNIQKKKIKFVIFFFSFKSMKKNFFLNKK